MNYFTDVITSARELANISIIVRPLVACALGGIVGFERGIKNRPAGLRTYMLVALGACVVMLTNQYVYQIYNAGDVVRMGAQVISGIGFLGAGTIILNARNQIKGLTTAAGLWADACVGLSVGIGLYEVAIVSSALIFLILSVMNKCDGYMHKKTKIMDAYVELMSKRTMGVFLGDLRKREIEVSNIQIITGIDELENFFAFTVTLETHKKQTHCQMLQSIRELQNVGCIEELR